MGWETWQPMFCLEDEFKSKDRMPLWAHIQDCKRDLLKPGLSADQRREIENEITMLSLVDAITIPSHLLNSHSADDSPQSSKGE